MNMPDVVRTPADLRARVAAWRSQERRVALVPTMGALHAGHLSLLAVARSRADAVVASIFVNPTQFAPDEDLAAYPRDEEADQLALGEAGCDLLYAPAPETIYPPGFSTTVSVSGVSAPLEGRVRPTHFAGVATVVAKLLIQTAPDVAVFGEKDWQQLAVIRRLAADLDLAAEIIAGPIVREADGLALSSRNAYLTPVQRAIAPGLHRGLMAAAKALVEGAGADRAEELGRQVVLSAGFDALDYLAVCDPESLGSPPSQGSVRLLAAARLGKTRLIDNIEAIRA
jgi:pantoate--beta-alanine ligase